MHRTLIMEPLNTVEKQRLQEIRLYYLVTHIFNTYGNRLSTFEFFDSIGTRLDISINTLRQVLTALIAENNTVRPTLWELVILLYKNGTPVSLICRTAGKLAPKTAYNYIQEYLKTPTEFHTRFKPELVETLNLLYPFLKKLIVTENHIYDEYNIQT